MAQTDMKPLLVFGNSEATSLTTSSTAQMHLLYTRFRSVISQLSPLLSELEHCTEAHLEDLSALLSECHSAYFAVRKGLLVGHLMAEICGNTLSLLN
jgi:hypothetical protein